MTSLSLIVIFFLPTLLFGQDNPDCYAEKDFLIVYATKNYSIALSTAKQASKKLNIQLDLRNLLQDSDTLHGLTLPSDTCLKYWGDLDSSIRTCYVARGRYDDGIYISIEYSSSYYSCQRGYYIVMVDSGFKGDGELKSTLKKVKTKYTDAYIKTSKVYMCCSR